MFGAKIRIGQLYILLLAAFGLHWVRYATSDVAHSFIHVSFLDTILHIQN